MSYYHGDYYRGDYYQGDPGLFDVVRKIGGAIFKRTPVGTAIEVGRALIPTLKKTAPPAPDYGPPGQFPRLPPPGQLPEVLVGGGISGFPLRPMAQCGLKGYRVNKSTYITRGGGTSRWPPGQLLVHPKGTECVKVRRMNVGNTRALRRAIRRAMGYKKLAMRVLRLTSPGTKRKFGGFKKRRAA